MQDSVYGGPSGEAAQMDEQPTSTEQPESSGRKFCFLIHADGLCDVYEESYQSVSMHVYPNGIFQVGFKDAVRGMMALYQEQDGGEARSIDEAMTKAFNEKGDESSEMEGT